MTSLEADIRQVQQFTRDIQKTSSDLKRSLHGRKLNNADQDLVVKVVVDLLVALK